MLYQDFDVFDRSRSLANTAWTERPNVAQGNNGLSPTLYPMQQFLRWQRLPRPFGLGLGLALNLFGIITKHPAAAVFTSRVHDRHP
jgi:hypothetical protein